MRLVLCLLAAFVLTACGERWVPNQPRTLSLGDPRLAYEATLHTLASRRYVLDERNDRQLYVRVRAILDGFGDTLGGGWTRARTDRATSLAFQIYPDGQLAITASGYHIREDNTLMHHELAEEIDGLSAAIESTAASMRAGATPMAAPAAAPPPQ